MRRHSKRLAKVDPQVVRLRDFELYDDGSGVSVTVFGTELMEVASALAEANAFTVQELLSSKAIPAGVELSCCTVGELPRGRGWSFDASGYIMIKLKRSSTMAGHSFLGNARTADADHDYDGSSTSGRRRPSFEAGSPRPRKTRRLGPPGWLESFSRSPGSPESELAGCTHPLPIRWHRAAALALSSDPAAESGLVVRHICGNKRCAKVSHFKVGSQSENAADETFHRAHPRCSRGAYPELA